MTYYVVQIGDYPAKAYSEEELEALVEARKVYYGEPADCKKALYGLYLIMTRRAPASVVKVIDENLAAVIRNDKCI